MKKRKILLTLAGILVFSMNVFGTTSSAAGNYHDTTFAFSFSNYSPSYLGWVTTPREKLDYTSSYMKCKSATSGHSYVAFVGACRSIDDPYRYEVGSPSYTFVQGTTRYMINYVKERGYDYACIKAEPNDYATWNASGVWSPDSI